MVTTEDFARAMKKIGLDDACPKIAVAVSGGGDSLALCLLMQEWVAARDGEMLALTVDHQLRPSSTDEALAVQKLLSLRGIAHEILTWQGEKPTSQVQEMARQARYELLLKTCMERGFLTLAIAHNVEDQAETFWMRLAHGSGLDGLASMAPVRDVDGVKMIRPLLSFSREQLRATCAECDVDWIEDPSNQNDRYLRVRLRQFEDVLAGEGLTPSRLSQTAQKLEDARDALVEMTRRALDECATLHDEGYATLRLEGWKNYPRDIQRRMLSQLISAIAPQTYPVGFEALEQTRVELLSGFSGRTLAGCDIFPGKQGLVLIAREIAAAPKRTPLVGMRVWDGRFVVSGAISESTEIGILGEEGLSQLRKLNIAIKEVENLPYKVKCTLPAFWQGGNVVAVPHLNYYAAQGLRDVRLTAVKIG